MPERFKCMQQFGEIENSAHQPELMHNLELTWKKYTSERWWELTLQVSITSYCSRRKQASPNVVSFTSQLKNLHSILHCSTTNIANRPCVGVSNQKTASIFV